MNLKVIALATVLSFSTPVITNFLMPSTVLAMPQFPTGTFSDEQWSVLLQYENNTYSYQGKHKQSGNTLNLSGAQLSGSSERPIFTWRNGEYRYQVAWQPNDPEFLRLQVFAPNGTEILNRLLTQTSASIAHQPPSNTTSTNTPSTTTATSSAVVTAWEQASRVRTIEDRSIRGDLVSIYDVNLSDDGRYVASGNSIGYTKIWEISSGNEVNKFEFNESGSRSARINSVAFSPNSQNLVSGSRNMVEVRQYPSGNLLYRLGGSGGRVILRPNSEQFVSGLSDYQIKLWNLRSGELIKGIPAQIQVTQGERTPLSISANGQYLVGGGMFGKINVWNLETGNLKRSLTERSGSVISTAISANGELVFSSHNRSSEVVIWNSRTGKIIRSLNGHSNEVQAIEISPNGEILATGSADGTIRLWNLKTRELVRILDNNAGKVLSLDFSSDSRTLATSTEKGTIVIWQAQ